MSERDQLRIGDAERDAAASALREHFAQGRLSVDELNERLDAALAARTVGDLRAILADLPAGAEAAALEPVTFGPSGARWPGREPTRSGGSRARPAWGGRRIGPPLPLFPILFVVLLLAATGPGPGWLLLPALVFIVARTRCAAWSRTGWSRTGYGPPMARPGMRRDRW